LAGRSFPIRPARKKNSLRPIASFACDAAGDLTLPGRLRHLATMTLDAQLLRDLRRSLLGAWLAVAYALALIASALAPSPASAHRLIDGAVLCTGLTPPGQDVPDPADGSDHCKGCFGNPLLAGPGHARQTTPIRVSADAPAPVASASRYAPASILGLPPSRAPPATARLV
jgi:hypothetical protein